MLPHTQEANHSESEHSIGQFLHPQIDTERFWDLVVRQTIDTSHEELAGRYVSYLSSNDDVGLGDAIHIAIGTLGGRMLSHVVPFGRRDYAEFANLLEEVGQNRIAAIIINSDCSRLAHMYTCGR